MEALAIVSLIGCLFVLAAVAGYANFCRAAANVGCRMVSIPALPPIAAVADEFDLFEASPSLIDRLAA